MKTIIILSAVLFLTACGTIDKIVERRVNYEKCVASLTAGGVDKTIAEQVCKKLSENAQGVAALRGAI